MICKEWPHLSVLTIGIALGGAAYYLNRKPQNSLVPNVEFPIRFSSEKLSDISEEEYDGDEEPETPKSCCGRNLLFGNKGP